MEEICSNDSEKDLKENEQEIKIENQTDEQHSLEDNEIEIKTKSTFFSKNGIHILNITRTLSLRMCIIGYSIWITAFVACIQQNKLFWMLIIPIFLIFVDTLYICIIRKGIEFDW